MNIKTEKSIKNFISKPHSKPKLYCNRLSKLFVSTKWLLLSAK